MMARRSSATVWRALVLAALALMAWPATADAAKKRGGRGKPAPAAKSPKPAPDDGERRRSGGDEAEAVDNEDRGSNVREAPDGDADTERPRSRRRATIRAASDDSDEADVAATAEPVEPASDKAGRWLELAIGARGFTRDLRYHQQVTPSVREHKLALGPAVVLDVAFYPLALATRGPAANIGIVAGFEQAVGISSQLDPDATFPNGAIFPTSMQELSGGLRYRIPLAGSQISVSAIGGQHAFWFANGDGAARTRLEIPDVIYQYVRAGVDGRLAVTADFYLAAGAGYRYILNSGGHVRTFFPHLTVAGVDADVGAGYRITRTVEARMQGGIRRYFYDMHSIAGDARIAGGAVDQYLSLAGLLAITLE